MFIKKKVFGKTPKGETVDQYILTNENGMKVRIISYGGIVTALEIPDRIGNLDDIVLGYDELSGYLKKNPYFGAIVGRYGNRIAGGKFVLNGKEYQLVTKNGKNHQHGGTVGFDKIVWNSEAIQKNDTVGVQLTHVSPDGDECYPGNLSCKVTYMLTNNNDLIIRYHATTDKSTIINLTHHSYFNLAGQVNRDILEHEIKIVADRFTPTDENQIPTGELCSVKGTPMDFTKPTVIGSRIEQEDQQLKYGGGYDHNWILNNQDGSLALAAQVYEPTTGRVLEIYTTEPGVQFYTGNNLDGSITGKNGIVYKRRYGLCLETQHYPDSPNKINFPSVVLNPGEIYTQETVHRFYTR